MLLNGHCLQSSKVVVVLCGASTRRQPNRFEFDSPLIILIYLCSQHCSIALLLLLLQLFLLFPLPLSIVEEKSKQTRKRERDSERKKKRLYTRGNGQVETHIHLSSHLIFAKIIQAFNTPFLKRPLKQAARERGSKRDFQTQHATGELICEVCG